MNASEPQTEFTESQKRRRIFLVSWHDDVCDLFVTIPLVLTYKEAVLVKHGIKLSSGSDAVIIMGVP